MTSKPHSVVMLAFQGAQILDVVGPMQILAAVNDERPSPAYALTLLAEKPGPFATSGGLRLDADGDYGALPAKIGTLMIAGLPATVQALLLAGTSSRSSVVPVWIAIRRPQALFGSTGLPAAAAHDVPALK